MTFSSALTILRRDVLGEPESAHSSFSDVNDLLPMLYRASAEIAAQAEFPVALDSTITAAAGATSVSAPNDMVWPRSVVLHNDELDLMDYSFVRRKQRMADANWTRYYSFDPRRSGAIEFGPPIPSAVASGDLTVEYVQAIDTSALTSSSQVWSTLFPDWHHMVAYRAGVYAWDSVGEYEASQYWNQRVNLELQGLASRLGRTNIPNLLLPREQRDDEGTEL